MVDLNTCPPTPPPGTGERSKITSFMGRTPGIGVLKTKFLTVLGNSNDLLNGISNKLTLSLDSSDSDYCDDEEDLPKFDESIDYTKIDFESRRVKARRAHEEIISGRFRHPNFAPKARHESKHDSASKHSSPASRRHRSLSLPKKSHSSSDSSSDSSTSHSAHNVNERTAVSSTTCSQSLESRHSAYGCGRQSRATAGARRSELDLQKDLLRKQEVANTPAGSGACTPFIDVQPPSDAHSRADPSSSLVVMGGATTSANSMCLPVARRRSRTSQDSSTLTSLRDETEQQHSPSADSITDWRNFIRSESQNSVPSWASSISLDCRAAEEPIKEFMQRFTDILFSNPPAITVELKSEFGAFTRMEHGRLWFTRCLMKQRAKSKRVEELTFHSLLQFFSLVLFECAECADYGPAMVIMNLCFLFYHEIEVPGCDPYCEYLFCFMRQQPIWHTLRFWNATFYDAVQNEREQRLAQRIKRAEKRLKSKEELNAKVNQVQAAAQDSSSSSSHHSNAVVGSIAKEQEPDKEHLTELRLQENIVFKQLGILTSNMHSLGVPQEMCLEFLKKQMNSFNLPKDKAKIVRDNILRMYHETKMWGAKES